VTDRGAPRFGPVERTTLPGRVADRLDEAIASGRYRGGERLPPVAELARRFGVAPPTVRAALGRLERAGRVEIRRRAGAYVTGDADAPPP
jgi:DNA-binding FadR family transcriptional regulator